MDGPSPLVGRRTELAVSIDAPTPRRIGATGVMVLAGGCLPLSGSLPLVPTAEAKARPCALLVENVPPRSAMVTASKARA